MTHLRTMTIEELVRRNYSNSTRECHIRTINEFALYFSCSPDNRVAISNHRLIYFENGEVTFTWRDCAHGNV